jgi:G3E family GTPase
LVIVSGFLGAGKSTWLRHQIHEGRFGRAHVIVNEAAETPVDDLLLSNAESLEVLAGGCVCCAGRQALRASLAMLCNNLDRQNEPSVDRVILETSGLADAGAISNAISSDPMLGHRLTIEETIVLVDASSESGQVLNEPLARAQVEAADAVVVTKPGATDREHRSAVAATLRKLAPEAVISWAEFGAPVEADFDAGSEPLSPRCETLRMEPILPYHLDIQGASWVGMSAWLSALLVARGNDIMRVKGVMRTPAGRLLLQSVRNHVQPAEILPEMPSIGGITAQRDNFLVLIGRGIDRDRLAESWQKFVLSSD